MAAITHPGLQLPTIPWPTRAGDRPVRHRPLASSVYRRRRLAVAALFLGVFLAANWVLGALGGGSLAVAETGAPPARVLSMQPVSRATYVVAPGDTLWSIARHLVPEGDVRPVVDSLAAHRNGRPLQAGERIVLP